MTIRFIKCFSILLLLVVSTSSFAQNKKRRAVSKKILSPTEVLAKALEDGDERKAADAYLNLGEVYFNEGDYVKSEDHYKKAIRIYQKYKSDRKLADATRKLALTQERLNKKKEAKVNYSKSADYNGEQKNKVYSTLNQNDYDRVNTNSLAEKEALASKNISILNEYGEEDDQEQFTNYTNLGDIQVQQNEIEAAVTNYKKAISSVNADADQLMAINEKISNAYLTVNNFDKALKTNEDLLEAEPIAKDKVKVVEVMNAMSDILIKSKDNTEAIKTLEESFKVATQYGQTLEAKEILTKLYPLYDKVNQAAKAHEINQRFIDSLAVTISRDSSLIDQKVIALTNDKIAKLEAQQKLKDRLISNQTNLNYIFAAGFLILCLFVYLIYRSLRALKKTNKQIELQSLRKEMNPHFIFNSLNSVNQFIATNDERTANSYLTRFATLMRNVLDHSSKDFITLSQELDLLTNYLQLEHQRFKNKFDYTIDVDPDLNTEEITIPNMLIQPYLENAIWHGIRYKEAKGKLHLKVTKESESLLVLIIDDGIGIEGSLALKTKHQKEHKSKGRKNILDRIHILNDLYNERIKVTTSKGPNEVGTMVKLSFLINNPKRATS